MAFWGVALANGPHINFPMVPPDRAKAAWEALTRAKQLSSRGTEVEQALIEGAFRPLCGSAAGGRQAARHRLCRRDAERVEALSEGRGHRLHVREAMMDLRHGPLDAGG